MKPEDRSRPGDRSGPGARSRTGDRGAQRAAGRGEEAAALSSVTPEVLSMSAGRRRIVTAGVMLGMFLAALEATVVSTAMPTVIASLGGLAHYSWVFSAYLITSTVTVPVWGKLSDIYGRRRFYQLGIALFLAGSVLSGIAQSMGQLIAYRAIQGLGAGALIPLGMTIVGDIYTVDERARMQALFSGVWGLSSVVGPMVGGFLTDQLSWRWVFFINLPFGILSAIVIGATLPERERHERPSIDYAGAAILMVSISLLMLGLIEGGKSLTALLAPRSLLFFASSVGLLALFLYVETRARHPIVPLPMFRNRVVAVSVAAGFLAGMAMFGVISFIPLFAQGAMNSTATEAGSLLTPLMLSWVGLSIVGGRLLLRIGYRTTSIVGFLFLTIGLFLLSNFQPAMPRPWLYVNLVAVGAGLGLTMLTLLIAVQQAVPRTELGIATSLNQFSRSIGGAVGVGFMGVLLSAGLTSHLAAAARRGLLSPAQAEHLSTDPSALIEQGARAGLSDQAIQVLQGSLASAMHSVFWVGTAMAALGFVVVLFLPRDTALRPQEEPCSPDSGQRLVMAELATIDPEHEPRAVKRREER